MSNIILSRPAFTQYMRQFSNDTTQQEQVHHATWKAIRQVALDSQTINFEVGDTYIQSHSRHDHSNCCFTCSTHPSIMNFINFIMTKIKMSSTTITPSTNATFTIPTENNLNRQWNINEALIKLNETEQRVNELKREQEKKEKNMFNFDFGKITSDAIRMSMYGIAIKNADNRYVSYDSKTNSVMDVEILNMPANDFLYKMPVAIKDVKTGDVVIHNRVPMFVVETHESTITVIDIREGTEKEIYLTKNMFNFNYAVKVVSLMDIFNNEIKPSADNPFGNIGLYMMMFNENNDMSDILPLMLMNGNTNNFNPMMMYFLMKNNTNQDMLPLMMMMMKN